MKKKRIIIAIILILSVLVGGAGFNTKTVKLDTEKNKVYKDYYADTILNCFTNMGKNACKNSYDGKYVMILGKLSSKTQNNKTVEIVGFTNTSATISCSTSAQNLIDRIGREMSVGDKVKVYGKLSVDTWNQGKIKISVDNIYASNTANEEISYNSYSMFSYFEMGEDNIPAQNFDLGDYKEISFDNGIVRYKVPNTWESITTDCSKDNFWCNQYRLNELANGYSKTPESLYVFYFDNDGLAPDSDKSDTQGIECAIAANILGLQEDKIEFPYCEVTTYYKQEYDYFEGTYHSTSLNKDFSTEFVFMPVGNNKGICGFLYVYSVENVNHLQNVLFMMRNVSVAGT